MQISTELTEMAKAARALDDDEWGSERNIAAFNAFNVAASALLTPENHEAWDRYSMKATIDEIVDEALRLIASQ